MKSKGIRIQDARGRRVNQLDPVAMYLLRRFDSIGPDDLREIALRIDAGEVRKRPFAVLWAPIWVVLWYTAFLGYFYIFERWRGWNPVLIGFAISYFLFPFLYVYRGFRKARRARWTRIRAVMLRHLRCPHCGYDIRGLPADAEDGATVCPECGCAWTLTGETAADEANESSARRRM